MKDVYILDAVRTPVGRMGGTLKTAQAHDLGALVCKALMERTGLSPDVVEEVVIAQVKQNAKASNIARVISLMAGFREEIPAYTLMMQCGSSLQSVNCAANDIRCGEVAVAVAGGVEAMSDTPFELWGARYGYGTGNNAIYDPIIEGARRAQPQDTYGVFGMGDTAENVAEKYGISRQAMDEFAFESQTKAAAAIAAGVFKDEIVPVTIPQRKKEPIIFDTDEQPRETSMEALAKLKPVFRTDGKGLVTAGNSCGRSDAGAALLLATEEKVRELGVKPMARIVSQAIVGVDPRLMGIGPVPAVRKVLAKTGLQLEDIGLFELNEAFAAQSLAVIQELGLDRSKVNINGGAIALGHPLGATGARILTTLVHSMKRTGTRYGIATLCMGGGQGGAILLESVK
ncbi:MAG: thiolase family protein [Clostridiales bacterium]|nr:thiolase family protein [Clostridiales bacterium]